MPIDLDIETARRILESRRRRGRYLPLAILGEPAWDILLDLLVSAADGVPVPLKSACLAAGVPPTTAMRCVDVLGGRGLVRVASDPRDGRRKLLELTEDGMRATRSAVRDAARSMRTLADPVPTPLQVRSPDAETQAGPSELDHT